MKWCDLRFQFSLASSSVPPTYSDRLGEKQFLLICASTASSLEINYYFCFIFFISAIFFSCKNRFLEEKRKKKIIELDLVDWLAPCSFHDLLKSSSSSSSLFSIKIKIGLVSFWFPFVIFIWVEDGSALFDFLFREREREKKTTKLIMINLCYHQTVLC